MQGFNVHSRIIHRIHGLLDRQLLQLSDALMSENRSSYNLSVLILQSALTKILDFFTSQTYLLSFLDVVKD